MTTSITSYQTAVDTYLEPFADGLIKFAETDSEFAESLAALTVGLPETPGRYTEEPHKKPHFFTPIDQDDAVAVAAWLHQLISTQPTRTRHTAAKLQTWAEPFRAPKDQVFGIIGIAIIGPTLGLIKKKKKRKSIMHTVISNEWKQTHTSVELAELTTKISQQVIRQELKLAGGNTYNLHPDSAAWCMEEALTKIHTASNTELSKLLCGATAEQLSHSALYEDEQLIAVALSPVINETVVNDYLLEEIKR